MRKQYFIEYFFIDLHPLVWFGRLARNPGMVSDAVAGGALAAVHLRTGPRPYYTSGSERARSSRCK